jgi:hypothetical protein
MTISNEHKDYRLTKLIDKPDKEGKKALFRAATADDITHTMSGNIPEVGDVRNVPVITLDARTIMLVGNSYLVILEESGAADGSV